MFLKNVRTDSKGLMVYPIPSSYQTNQDFLNDEHAPNSKLKIEKLVFFSDR